VRGWQKLEDLAGEIPESQKVRKRRRRRGRQDVVGREKRRWNKGGREGKREMGGPGGGSSGDGFY